MTEHGRFFDGVSYGEGDQAEVQARMWRDGVIQGVGSELAVTSGGAGLASVATGEAFVQGFWYKNDAAKTLAITANLSATPRVDVVVLHLDRSANTLQAVIHQGVLGAGVPTLTQVVGGVWEIPLANISTASGISTFTDTRLWQSNVFNPMTTSQDIIIADAAGRPQRKAKGANGTFLGVDGAGALNYSVPIGFANPMTTTYDIIEAGVGGVALRRPKGAADTVYATNDIGVNGYSKVVTAMIAANAVTNYSNSATFSQLMGVTNPWAWMSSAAQAGHVFSGGYGLCIMWGWVQCNASLGNIAHIGIGLDSNTGAGVSTISQGNNGCAVPYCLVYPAGALSGSHTFYGVGGTPGGTCTFTGQMQVLEFKK
jgi:hypothetical protein